MKPVDYVQKMIARGKVEPTDEQVNRKRLADKTHAGFTVTCEVCGSQVVEVSSDVGWSGTSGGWGGVDMTCCDCGKSVSLFSAI